MTTSTTLPQDTLRSGHFEGLNHTRGVLRNILRSLEGIYLQISGPGTTQRDRLHSDIAKKTSL